MWLKWRGFCSVLWDLNSIQGLSEVTSKLRITVIVTNWWKYAQLIEDTIPSGSFYCEISVWLMARVNWCADSALLYKFIFSAHLIFEAPSLELTFEQLHYAEFEAECWYHSVSFMILKFACKLLRKTTSKYLIENHSVFIQMEQLQINYE